MSNRKNSKKGENLTYQKKLVSFDYAIKYILKEKSDYKILESFISAVLSTKNYGPIKILHPLDCESNKEDAEDKGSLVDLMVQDSEKQQYIIEIDRNLKYSFLEKACFTVSRTIADSVKSGANYLTMPKVIHISLLYFPIGEEPVYHYKGEPIGVSTNKPLIITKKNLLPEYFIISIPLFNDKIETEIDEWLYLLKNEETPKHFKSKYMQNFVDRLTFLKMDEKARNTFLNFQKKKAEQEDELISAKNQGIEQGIQQGIEQGIQQGEINAAVKIARGLLKSEMTLLQIQQVTQLPLDVIEKLKK